MGADCVWFDRVTNLSRPPLVAYSEYNSSYDDIVRVRSFDGADWASESDAYDTNDSGVLKWHVAATSADRSRQAVVAVGTGSNTLYASLYDGSTWTTANLGTVASSDYRCFAAAYEQQSGQLLIVAGTTSNKQIKYWVHDGSSWVVNGSTYTFTTDLYDPFKWVRMDARPNSNQIALIVRPNSNHVGALIWDGEANSWGYEKRLSDGGLVPANSQLCHVDVKYMRAGPYKGRAVFVWHNNANLYSWTWTGGAWESAAKSKSSAAGTTIAWIELAADPNSSRLLAALGDCNEYLYTVDWSGSSWGTSRQVSTALMSTIWYGRRFAVSFESGTGHTSHAVIAYSDTANLKYRHTSDISGAWGSETDISTSYDCNWVELALDADNTIHLMCQEEDGPDDLLAYTWNNSSWTSEGILETDLQYDSNGTYEAFAITTYPPAAASDAGMAGMGPMVGYSVSTSPQWVTHYSIWDGSDFFPESTGPTFGASVNIDWVVVETTPTGKMMVGKDNANNAYASFFDGTSWGPVKSLGAVANNGSRGFDAAVERLSGRVMIVAGSGTSLKYWVYDGGSWVVDGSTISGSLGSGTKYFVEMASHPSSNEIALTFCDSVNDAYGVIWSGSAWGNEQILDANLSLSNYFQPVGVEYIRSGSGAGKAMFAWGATDGTAKMESRTWNGSGWDSEFAAIDPGGGICYLRLDADPNSNRMVCAITRSNWTGVVAVFNGTSWDSPVTVDTLFGQAYRPIDVIFETASGHEGDILVVYSDSDESALRARGLERQHLLLGRRNRCQPPTTVLGCSWNTRPTTRSFWRSRQQRLRDLNTWSWNNSSWTYEKEITGSLTANSTSNTNPFYFSQALSSTPG